MKPLEQPHKAGESQFPELPEAKIINTVIIDMLATYAKEEEKKKKKNMKCIVKEKEKEEMKAMYCPHQVGHKFRDS